ncbi:MAG: glycosyltransferase family 2 protein [Clostridia bacterium]
MKKVSIIIPIYNGEKFIRQCIQSIRKQTYKNIEIICIDDGSTDDTKKVLQELSKIDNRIMIIAKENEGVSIARNAGIQKATGDYITFIDIDDWIEIDWIEKLVEKIEEEECEVIRGNFVKENEQRELVQYGNLQDLKNVYINNLEEIEKIQEYIIIGKLPAYTWLLLIKRQVIQGKIKFQENIPFMEDTIFYIELLNHTNNIYIYDLRGYHYFYNSNSATKNPELYRRNIENVKKVNIILQQMVKPELYSRMNMRHMKSIKEYLFKLYKYHKIKRKEIKQILEDKMIRNMLKNIQREDLDSEKIISMMKKKQYIRIENWFSFRRIISKIRDKFLGER